PPGAGDAWRQDDHRRRVLLGLLEFLALQPRIPEVLWRRAFCHPQGPAPRRRVLRGNLTAVMVARVPSARRWAGAGTGPRVGAPLVNRHMAIIDSLLVRPFRTKPFLAGERGVQSWRTAARPSIFRPCA